MQSITVFLKLNIKCNYEPLRNCNGSAYHAVTIRGQENCSIKELFILCISTLRVYELAFRICILTFTTFAVSLIQSVIHCKLKKLGYNVKFGHH